MQIKRRKKSLQAVIEGLFEGGFVEVLTDEDKFLHAVAVVLVMMVVVVSPRWTFVL